MKNIKFSFSLPAKTLFDLDITFYQCTQYMQRETYPDTYADLTGIHMNRFVIKGEEAKSRAAVNRFPTKTNVKGKEGGMIITPRDHNYRLLHPSMKRIGHILYYLSFPINSLPLLSDLFRPVPANRTRA